MIWEGRFERWQVLLHRAQVRSAGSAFFQFHGCWLHRVLPSTVVAIGVVDMFASEIALTKKRDDTACGQRFLQTKTRNTET